MPHHGVGLARLEFIINRMIGVHPRALLEFDTLDPELQGQRSASRWPATPIRSASSSTSCAEGIAQIAAAFAPEPVIVRLSDFKSNEYANLIGGRQYEPHEENPMLGFRGASRYVDETSGPASSWSAGRCKRVRERDGADQRAGHGAVRAHRGRGAQVTELLAANGLERGENGLKVIMMCELPTNALLADQYLEYFDGMSIGSNDMTQLTLGLDRDSAIVAQLFDERDEAVKALLRMAITRLPQARQVRRHLRPGPLGSPGPGALAGGRGHRQHVAQSGHRGRDLAVPGERRREGQALTANSAFGALWRRRFGRPAYGRLGPSGVSSCSQETCSRRTP